jgi:hypothetical protein
MLRAGGAWRPTAAADLDRQPALPHNLYIYARPVPAASATTRNVVTRKGRTLLRALEGGDVYRVCRSVPENGLTGSSGSVILPLSPATVITQRVSNDSLGCVAVDEKASGTEGHFKFLNRFSSRNIQLSVKDAQESRDFCFLGSLTIWWKPSLERGSVTSRKAMTQTLPQRKAVRARVTGRGWTGSCRKEL